MTAGARVRTAREPLPPLSGWRAVGAIASSAGLLAATGIVVLLAVHLREAFLGYVRFGDPGMSWAAVSSFAVIVLVWVSVPFLPVRSRWRWGLAAAAVVPLAVVVFLWLHGRHACVLGCGPYIAW